MHHLTCHTSQQLTKEYDFPLGHSDMEDCHHLLCFKRSLGNSTIVYEFNTDG